MPSSFLDLAVGGSRVPLWERKMIDQTQTSSAKTDGISHVVLLLLENHSFDQMLGALQQEISEVDGVAERLE